MKYGVDECAAIMICILTALLLVLVVQFYLFTSKPILVQTQGDQDVITHLYKVEQEIASIKENLRLR